MIKVEKCVFQYIEHELYCYDDTRKDLEFQIQEIIHGKLMPDVKVQNEPGDTTSNKAIRLATSAYILQAEKNLKAIDKALDMLADIHRELFKLKYQSRLSWKEVMLEMNISESTYFRLRRTLVTAVGQKMGLLNIK